MSNETKDKSKFNLSLIRSYKTKKGFLSVDIDSEAYDALQKVEIGGRLVLKIVENKKTDKSPDAYFEYMTPNSVNDMKERFKKFQKAKQDSEDVL